MRVLNGCRHSSLPARQLQNMWYWPLYSQLGCPSSISLQSGLLTAQGKALEEYENE